MEDRLFKQWLVDYSRMDKETFISFENYKSKLFKTENNKPLDVKEILRKAEITKKLDQKHNKKPEKIKVVENLSNNIVKKQPDLLKTQTKNNVRIYDQGKCRWQ